MPTVPLERAETHLSEAGMVLRSHFSFLEVRSNHLIRVVCAAGLTLFLAACSQEGSAPVVSLEEAKQITAEFENPAFVAPPRTIEDITLSLQESRRTSQSQLQEAKDMVSREPASSLDGDDLARFYVLRARAHHTLGRIDREIADYRLASEYAEGQRLFRAAMELSWAEWRGGNWSRAVLAVEKACEEAQWRFGDEPWDAWHCKADLSSYAAELGNLPLAKATWEVAERIWAKFSIGDWTPIEQADIASARDNFKATVLLAEGKLADVEELARRAVQRFHPYKDSPFSWGEDIQLDINSRTYTWHLRLLSEALRRDGRLVEAEVEARKALLEALSASGRYSDHTAQNIEAVVAVLVEQGRYAEAQELVQASLEIYEAVGVPPDSYMMAKTQVRMADVLTAQGQWAKAVDAFKSARDAIKQDTVWSEQLLSHNLNWPLSLLKDGQSAKARVILKAAYARRRENLGETDYDTAETRAVFAMTVATMGERELALGHFRAAVPLLLQRSRRSDSESEAGSLRGWRLDLILDAYIRLLADVAGSPLEKTAGLDAVEEAFRMADVARSGSVHRALSATAARAAIDDPAIADLVRREQDTVKQIGGLYGSLARNLSLPSAERDAAGIEATRKRIDEFRAARATLMEAIEVRSPEYAALINPKAPTFSQLRTGLLPGEVVLAFYVSEAATYVWAVPKSGAAAFATVPLGRKALGQAVMRLRSALNPEASTLAGIPQFDVNTAHHLYQRLLMPVASAWLEAETLLVIADGALAQIPLSLLVTSPTELGPERAPLFSRYREVAWLAREFAVAVVPSAAALMALRMLPEEGTTARTYAGFGDPWFSLAQAQEARAEAARSLSPIAGGNGNEELTSASVAEVQTRGFERRSTPRTRGVSSAGLAMLPRLPGTAKEVLSIARALNADVSSDVFLGPQASEHTVKTTPLKDRKVLVFATHGLLPGDLDGLRQPALALTSPDVTGEREDGLLTTGEILTLKLNADWVVLSAC
ncbi:MAG: CHAT domain-containing protein, partial [Hyphomicrobium sp.]